MPQAREWLTGEGCAALHRLIGAAVRRHLTVRVAFAGDHRPYDIVPEGVTREGFTGHYLAESLLLGPEMTARSVNFPLSSLARVALIIVPIQPRRHKEPDV